MANTRHRLAAEPLPATPARTRAEEEARELRFLSCHHVYVELDGMVLTMPVVGYLDHPERPMTVVRHALDAVHGVIRTGLAEQPPSHMPAEVADIEYLACKDGHLTYPLNMPASILAVLHGRVYYPLHGPVAAIRRADDAGVRRKLTRAHKEHITATLMGIVTVLTNGPMLATIPPGVAETVRYLAKVMTAMDEHVRTGAVTGAEAQAAPAP
jgi:hypothetical protein